MMDPKSIHRSWSPEQWPFAFFILAAEFSFFGKKSEIHNFLKVDYDDIGC